MADAPKNDVPKSDVPKTDVITIDDFAKVKLRVAKVLEAKVHPQADKLLLLKVDLGDEQRQICAGIRAHYQPEDLVGKNVIVVANLAPRSMRGELSQGMLLAASTADRSQVIVLTTERDIAPGSSIS